MRELSYHFKIARPVSPARLPVASTMSRLVLRLSSRRFMQAGSEAEVDAEVAFVPETSDRLFSARRVRRLYGAGHAFMNPNNKEGYNAAAAQDAWGRIDGFFERLLRPGT